jgi:hypothetical protein
MASYYSFPKQTLGGQVKTFNQDDSFNELKNKLQKDESKEQ